MESPLVVASNRGPINFERDGSELRERRGSGGLVTALSDVFLRDDITWVSSAMTDGDLEVAEDGRQISVEPGLRSRFVVVPPDRYDAYYNRVANQMLWFAHHYLWDIARSPRFDGQTESDWQAFIDVNRAFAQVLADEAGRDPVFLIQDYHLSLVPAMLRALRPNAKIVHFTHTPFAGHMYLRVLPVTIREAILRGLAGADVLGFQSRAWGENYILSARGLSGIHGDLRRSRIEVEGRKVFVRPFPVAVNARALRETALRSEIKATAGEISRARRDRRLLLRVDRLEPSKNILRGFLAYELFLRRYESWRGRVKFLALLSPSRENLSEYQVYADDCLAEVKRINAELGDDEWEPIEVRVQEDYEYAVAAYGCYDVLMVNPVYDGMNLVAMEGPVVNRRQGVLILSRNAGAHSRLGKHALPINPFDLHETAEAIRAALEMPKDERARRSRGLSRSVQAHTPASWLTDQLDALDQVRPPTPR
ncbi:MAG: alpha,alpha-trehalose-phosphate synthase (UDP-forming) [Actinomycetota bacterium]